MIDIPARDVSLHQLRDSSHQRGWDTADETTTSRQTTSSSSRSLSPSHPLPNNISTSSSISNSHSRIQTLDGLLHWRQARRQLTTNSDASSAKTEHAGTRRCDDDLSQNKPLRCEHDLNHRQQQTQTQSRLVSDQFCVNCRQLMPAQSTPLITPVMSSEERRLSLEQEAERWLSSEQEAERRLSSEQEAENLRLRCDLLSSEEQSLLCQLRSFESRVLNETQQINNIDNEQHRVQQQIDALSHTYVNITLSVSLAHCKR